MYFLALAPVAAAGALLAPLPAPQPPAGRAAAPAAVAELVFPRLLERTSPFTASPRLLPLESGLRLLPRGAPKYVTFPILPSGD